jgi:Rubisco LSMT substrate-binding
MAPRSKRITQLTDWAQSDAVGIQISRTIRLDESPDAGIGWRMASAPSSSDDGGGGGASANKSSSLLITVPSATALTVECPGPGPNDRTVRVDAKHWPWYVQMAVYLSTLQERGHTSGSTSSTSNKERLDYRPWLEALPSSFDTPIHWSTLEELQYPPMARLVAQQRAKWTQYYTKVQELYPQMTYDDFVYWCEMSRSRGFSGSYSGNAFSPNIYAFTLLLVTAYVGLDLGTLEQAANGAGVVLAVSILKGTVNVVIVAVVLRVIPAIHLSHTHTHTHRHQHNDRHALDFVLPKLFFKTKRYVICPMIDMANHNSSSSSGGANRASVAFEYFGDAYSLALSTATTTTITTDNVVTARAKQNDRSEEEEEENELFISYGDRSNDQLLQYYGFVEANNPHEVYLLPPIRAWDLVALEVAGGRTVPPGRLAALAPALQALQQQQQAVVDDEDEEGNGTVMTGDDDDDDDDDDDGGGVDGVVVVARGQGVDPSALQLLRALLATEDEWIAAGRSVGPFQKVVNGENEKCVQKVVAAVLTRELQSKPTTLEQDEQLLLLSQPQEPAEQRLAIRFRIEKKKLLRETIAAIRTTHH